MKDDYLFDKAGEPDPETLRLEEQLRPARYAARAPADRVARARANAAKLRPDSASRQRTVVLVATLALAAAIFAVVQGAREWSAKSPPVIASAARPGEGPAPPTSGASLVVTRLAGAPRVSLHGSTQAITSTARLGVGAWLETDETSRAEIALADIGHVSVEPRSRVRLVTTAPNEQRLELAAGAIDARVIAVPRLFVVDTPAARATDLGCAYRLEVASDGGSLLRVRSGAVELAGSGVSSWVPAGAACETHAGRGPGCPYYEDALDAFREALHRLDAELGEPPPGAIEAVLSAARRRDTLTLWHLRARTTGRARDLVTARLEQLVPGSTGIDAGTGIEDLVTHW
jgi:hypothetical protein